MPTRILILGGYGETGRRLTKHLVAATEAHIVIAGRHLDLADELATSLQSAAARLSTAHVDASDESSILAALQNHHVDMLVIAAPISEYTENVIRACLAAKVDYLDVMLSQTKLELLRRYEDDIQEAGLTFITDAGYHPGLPAALIRYAADKIEAIGNAHITSAVVGGYLNMGKDLPYTEAVDELLEEMKSYRGQVYTNATWTKPSSWSMRKINFGNAIGERNCYSMYMDELGPLPQLYPTVQDIGLYMAGSNWFADLVLFPIIYLGLKLAPKRGIKPLGKLMWWGMQQSPGPYVCAVRAEVTGCYTGQETNSEEQVCIRALVAHEDGYELTAVPVVACLIQYLDSQSARPGLHFMGHYIEPVRALEDMEKMGIRIVREEDEAE